ncbi:MAG: ATP-binding cassette domain-containing protein [Mycobacteriaceae bacterium]|nr:ATP-binding cassette domain-containing protein [Mycobacteriaceae bacterium]
MEYGGRDRKRALDGIELRVPEGTVLGLLGPNGAGKTTTVRIITTLLRPTAGRVRVAGVDVCADPMGARRRLGLSGQYAAVDEQLTGFENLRMVARLYGMPRRRAAERADELLAAFGLEAARNARAGTYSGGMRRRLDLAGALVSRPRVVVLDEPTTGLDPRARAEMWQVITDLVADGSSVLLTTQYLEEADRLADSIAVIDHGTVIANGTPAELKSTIGGERLTVTLTDLADVPAAMAVLARTGVDSPRWEGDDTLDVTVAVADGSKTLVAVLHRLDQEHIGVADACVHRPSLDEVFFTLTEKSTTEITLPAADRLCDRPEAVRSPRRQIEVLTS